MRIFKRVSRYCTFSALQSPYEFFQNTQRDMCRRDLGAYVNRRRGGHFKRYSRYRIEYRIVKAVRKAPAGLSNKAQRLDVMGTCGYDTQRLQLCSQDAELFAGSLDVLLYRLLLSFLDLLALGEAYELCEAVVVPVVLFLVDCIQCSTEACFGYLRC